MFVNVNFHTNAGKVGETVRYVAHREETLPEGRTREIYGIGPRYRELRGDDVWPRRSRRRCCDRY
jgi:hypothetical protein